MFAPGTNVIAVEVHQNQTDSSDITFGLRLTADRPGTSNTSPSPRRARATPSLTVLPAFPTLWLNEPQADNVSGPVDNAGQREPWIELFNPGTNAVSLGGYFLSDNYTNLAQWAFPSNASVPAGGFLLVWCDAQTNQTTAGAVHAGFRLAGNSGQVALSRAGQQRPATRGLPHLQQPAGQLELRRYCPMRQPFYRGHDVPVHARRHQQRRVAADTRCSSTNGWPTTAARWPTRRTTTSKTGSRFYNPGTNAVDLGGCYLTDTLTNKSSSACRPTAITRSRPAGYLLVWADNETGQNNTNRADLHVNFALGKGGEAIGIFAADGTPVDTVTFGAQTTDVSQGRFPDGSPNIVSLVITTPGAPNLMPNTPPSLNAISNQELTLGQTLVFTASAADSDAPPQLVSYSLGAGAPAGAFINSISGQFQWTPAAVAPPATISVIATDNGTPPLSTTQTFQVTVHSPPTLSVQMQGSQMRLEWPRGTLQEATDVNGPYYDVPVASPLTVDLSESSRFYRLRL